MEERETVITYSTTGTATVDTDVFRDISFLDRMAQERPDEVQLVQRRKDGGGIYKVPSKWISIRPPKQMNYSDEQLKNLRQRMIDFNKNRSNTV